MASTKVSESYALEEFSAHRVAGHDVDVREMAGLRHPLRQIFGH